MYLFPDDDPDYERNHEQCQKKVGDKEEPQRCLAKSPHQPTRTVQAGSRPCASEWSEIETKRLNSSCSKQDRENIIVETQRIRTTKSKVNKHLPRPHRGPKSSSCFAIHHGAQTNIHWKAVEIPEAKVAMDRDWSKWRLKHSSLSGIVISTTIPLVDRTLSQLIIPQIIHDLRATITSNTLPRRTFQNRFFPIRTLNMNGSGDLVHRTKIDLKIRTLPELWQLHDISLDSEKDRWLNHTVNSGTSVCKTSNSFPEHIEDRKSWNWRSARTELRM